MRDEQGKRPDQMELGRWLSKALLLKSDQVIMTQYHDFITQYVVLKLSTGDLANSVADRLQLGVQWEGRGKVTGWLAGSTTILVIASNVSPEATVKEVEEVFSPYGVVKDAKWNLREPDPENPGWESVRDGTMSIRLQVQEGKQPLPSWIRKGPLEKREVWALRFRGHKPHGCWRCGELNHLARNCVRDVELPEAGNQAHGQ